jgi:hypothetical protein
MSCIDSSLFVAIDAIGPLNKILIFKLQDENFIQRAKYFYSKILIIYWLIAKIGELSVSRFTLFSYSYLRASMGSSNAALRAG